MCDMAHCGRVVDWRRGKLPGDAYAWLAWLAGDIAVFAGLQPVVYCGRCVLAHAGQSAIV